MTPHISSLLETKVSIADTAKKLNRNKCFALYGYAGGMAVYYGLKRCQSICGIQTRFKIVLLELHKVSLTELSSNITYHFDIENMTLVRLVNGILVE